MNFTALNASPHGGTAELYSSVRGYSESHNRQLRAVVGHMGTYVEGWLRERERRLLPSREPVQSVSQSGCDECFGHGFWGLGKVLPSCEVYGHDGGGR